MVSIVSPWFPHGFNTPSPRRHRRNLGEIGHDEAVARGHQLLHLRQTLLQRIGGATAGPVALTIADGMMGDGSFWEKMKRI